MSDSENTVLDTVSSETAPQAPDTADTSQPGDESTEKQAEAKEPEKPALSTEEALKRVEKNRDKLLRKYERERAEKAQLIKTIEELKSAQTPAPQKQYDTVDELVKDTVQNALTAKEKSQLEQIESQRAAEAFEKAFEARVAENSKTISDLNEKVEQAYRVIPSLPQHVKDAFRDSEALDLVLYQMVSDPDVLEDLIDAPNRAFADRMIAKLEIRGQDLLKPKQAPVTNTPAPMSAARGSNVGTTKLENMSGKEILAWVKSK